MDIVLTCVRSGSVNGLLGTAELSSPPISSDISPVCVSIQELYSDYHMISDAVGVYCVRSNILYIYQVYLQRNNERHISSVKGEVRAMLKSQLEPLP